MNDTPDLEGLELDAAMRRQFERDSRGGTQERLRAERRAGRTPKQRVKRAKKPHALSYRYGDHEATLLAALGAKLAVDRTTVLDLAIAALAAREGVKIDD